MRECKATLGALVTQRHIPQVWNRPAAPHIMWAFVGVKRVPVFLRLWKQQDPAQTVEQYSLSPDLRKHDDLRRCRNDFCPPALYRITFCIAQAVKLDVDWQFRTWKYALKARRMCVMTDNAGRHIQYAGSSLPANTPVSYLALTGKLPRVMNIP